MSSWNTIRPTMGLVPRRLIAVAWLERAFDCSLRVQRLLIVNTSFGMCNLITAHCAVMELIPCHLGCTDLAFAMPYVKPEAK